MNSTLRRSSRLWSGSLILRAGFVLLVAVFSLPFSAHAHVKWFSEFSYADKPISYAEVWTTPFWCLVGLAVLVSVSMSLLEERMVRISWIAAIDSWFAERSDFVMPVMRLGVGVTLLWCWQAGKLLAPDLGTSSEWIIWLQVIVAILLVFPQTLGWAGAGILVLYALAIRLFGIFHMLDYLLFVGIGWFFISQQLKNESLRLTGLPALYATLGFCLIWLGLEKLIYPSWSKLLLEEHPVLALGIEHDFFVTLAAMVEIGLGFMIMVCLQERLLALTITLIFVLTTLVFGRAELVGHTVIHTLLIVFLFAGSGKLTPPLHWIDNSKLRIPAIAVGFVGLVALLMLPYSYGAARMYAASSTGQTEDIHETLIEANPAVDPPRLAIALHKDPVKGWNVELVTENFEFAPAAAGLEPKDGEGHAHLYIDGEKVARIYNQWYHIPNLPAGEHEITVTLNANNHAGISVEGRPVRASTEIQVLD